MPVRVSKVRPAIALKLCVDYLLHRYIFLLAFLCILLGFFLAWRQRQMLHVAAKRCVGFYRLGADQRQRFNCSQKLSYFELF